jgi:hypothetical protein
MVGSRSGHAGPDRDGCDLDDRPLSTDSLGQYRCVSAVRRVQPLGLPYVGWYDNFLIAASFVFNGAIIWYAWTWSPATP